MELSEKIRLLRTTINLSQEDFGHIFELSRAVIRDYESGKTDPKRIFLDKISILFDVSYKQLIEKETIKVTLIPSTQLINALLYGSLYKQTERDSTKLQGLNPTTDVKEKLDSLLHKAGIIYQELKSAIGDLSKLPNLDFYSIINLFKKEKYGWVRLGDRVESIEFLGTKKQNNIEQWFSDNPIYQTNLASDIDAELDRNKETENLYKKMIAALEDQIQMAKLVIEQQKQIIEQLTAGK